jgi:hypothetical protein
MSRRLTVEAAIGREDLTMRTIAGNAKTPERAAIMRQARRLPAIARPRRGPAEKASEQVARLAIKTGP